MSNVEKVSVALTPEMAEIMRQAVETGEYASASEVVRDALRQWKERRDLLGYSLEELRALVQQGIDSGPAKDGPAVMNRLRSKYKAQANGKKRK